MSLGRITARSAGPLAILVMSLWLTGCGGGGGGDAPKTKVTGKVTTGGQPVAGTVTFIDGSNKEYPSPIGPEGTYTIVNAPAGPVKVLVKGNIKVNAPKGTKMPDMPGTPTGGTDPPAKYATAAGGLTYEVKNGEQTHDIDLK